MRTLEVQKLLESTCLTARALSHPIVIAALGVWLLNDHVWKAAYGNAWTGKLSDVAGLIVFPLLPLGVREFGPWARRNSNGALLLSCTATALGFAMVNVSELGALAYRAGFGAVRYATSQLAAWATGSVSSTGFEVSELTQDVSDLWTLPAAAVPAVLAWGGVEEPSR